MGEPVFRHRESPSSQRFLCVFSQSQPEDAADTSFSIADPGDLNEGDVFWTGEFSQNNRRCSNLPEDSRSFLPTDKFGILAALPGKDRGGQAVYHASSVSSRSSSSSSRIIPKPPGGGGTEMSESTKIMMKLHPQSAPMKVPVLSKLASKEGRGKSSVLMEVDGDEEGEEEEEVMLPPHEMVAARGSNRSPNTTYSVLEGVGRTLKGRDLRQVRNAVWRRTGFLD